MTAPHPQADPLEWGRRVQPGGGEAEGSPEGEGEADSYIEKLTEDVDILRCSNTGFTSLADKKRLCQ